MSAPFPLTLRLAERLAALRGAPVDGLLSRRAGVALLDTLAVTLAGRDEPPVAHLRGSLPRMGIDPRGATGTALLLGTAAHALDFDDVAFGGHLSAVVVPAILAAIVASGGGRPISGADLVRAYVAGYEVWAELATRERTLYHVRGFHPTSALGAVAAAGAASVLLGADQARIAAALAIGASGAAGLAANFGTMTKSLHAGQAVAAGVNGALLALDGMTAAPDALEARNGFLSAFSPAGEIDLARGLNHDLDGGWMLARRPPNTKRFPVCYAAHRAIDGALALHAAGGPADLAAVSVRISDRHSGTLRHRAPETVAQARFSLEFVVATALLRGRLGLAELSEAGLRDPAVRALMPRIARAEVPADDAALDGWAAFDQVTLTTAGGRSLTGPEVRRPIGHADAPAGAEALRGKVADCLALAGTPQAAAVLETLCSDPAAIADARAPLAGLGALVAAGGAPSGGI